MARIYLAGPMRGYADWNFPAFFQWAEILRARGHKVVSPAEHDVAQGFVWEGATGYEDLSEIGFDLRQALMWDLQQVSTSDAIFLLNGWDASKGALAEKAVAEALGVEIRTQADYTGCAHETKFRRDLCNGCYRRGLREGWLPAARPRVREIEEELEFRLETWDALEKRYARTRGQIQRALRDIGRQDLVTEVHWKTYGAANQADIVSKLRYGKKVVK